MFYIFTNCRWSLVPEVGKWLGWGAEASIDLHRHASLGSSSTGEGNMTFASVTVLFLQMQLNFTNYILIISPIFDWTC